MLVQLKINDILLVDRAKLDFDAGFTVFTGETGAGKSFVLDSLAFALGSKLDNNIIKDGMESGQVVACFDISNRSEILDILKNADIEPEDLLIIKRVQNLQGRGRAFINDTPVSLAFLRNIGDFLVEFHGQHAERAFLQKSAHLKLLDSYGQLEQQVKEIENLHANWMEAKKSFHEKRIELEKAKADQEYLKAAADELQKLRVQTGEELELSLKRTDLMKKQRAVLDVQNLMQLLAGNAAPSSIVADICKRTAKLEDYNAEAAGQIISYFDEALNLLNLAEQEISTLLREMSFDANELEAIEDRLFAIRAASRKYNLLPDELVSYQDKLLGQLDLIENAEQNLESLNKLCEQLQQEYITKSTMLSSSRKAAAARLESAVMKELPDLKLEHAQFIVHFQEDSIDYKATGIDEIEFWVKTNPKTNPGPLMKIASGGELSRFLLAVRVVFLNKVEAQTLIFDEVDTGVGGAVGEAIGRKLLSIASNAQVIAVTHLPQVAALSDHHFLVSKDVIEDGLYTNVKKLNNREIIEELARMLSGSVITEEARASAMRLINNKSEIKL